MSRLVRSWDITSPTASPQAHASGTERCAPGAPSGADAAARLIILLSTSDHFMIMLGALLIISTASLQKQAYTLAILAKRV